jgi:hypothetical protein
MICNDYFDGGRKMVDENIRKHHSPLTANGKRTNRNAPVVIPVDYILISGILLCYVRCFALPGGRVETQETFIFQRF